MAAEAVEILVVPDHINHVMRGLADIGFEKVERPILIPGHGINHGGIVARHRVVRIQRRGTLDP